MPNEERNKRTIDTKFECIQILQNQEGEIMEKTLYQEGFEYPTDVNIIRDPVFKKLINKYERLLKSDGLTPTHREEMNQVLIALDYGDRIFLDLDIEKEKIRSLEEQLDKYRKLYGPL